MTFIGMASRTVTGQTGFDTVDHLCSLEVFACSTLSLTVEQHFQTVLC